MHLFLLSLACKEVVGQQVGPRTQTRWPRIGGGLSQPLPKYLPRLPLTARQLPSRTANSAEPDSTLGPWAKPMPGVMGT